MWANSGLGSEFGLLFDSSKEVVEEPFRFEVYGSFGHDGPAPHPVLTTESVVSFEAMLNPMHNHCSFQTYSTNLTQTPR
jgi:hypothetical protein